MESKPESPALFAVPSQSRSRTSEVLRAIVGRINGESVTLRTLTDRLGD
jgi:hypothetical protein